MPLDLALGRHILSKKLQLVKLEPRNLLDEDGNPIQKGSNVNPEQNDKKALTSNLFSLGEKVKQVKVASAFTSIFLKSKNDNDNNKDGIITKVDKEYKKVHFKRLKMNKWELSVRQAISKKNVEALLEDNKRDAAILIQSLFRMKLAKRYLREKQEKQMIRTLNTIRSLQGWIRTSKKRKIRRIRKAMWRNPDPCP